VQPFRDIFYADQEIKCRFALMQVLTLTFSFRGTYVKENKGVAC
jgi:hypothetical protein